MKLFLQARLRSDKNPPSHGHHSHSACLTDKIQRKLASSLDFEDFTLTYKAKMKVYGQVSVLDEENNLYGPGQSQPGTGKHSLVNSEEFSDDYAEPLSVGISVSPQGQLGQPIYQAVNLPPVISHSSLSSPSSIDITHTFNRPASTTSTARHYKKLQTQTHTYQKPIKHQPRSYRTSSQNIYQAVNRSQSKTKLDHYGSSHRLEVKSDLLQQSGDNL